MAKAYMTSLPNTTDTQRNFIKTVDTPKVPAMDYRSGFKDVGAAIDNTNKFLGEYSQMKYEGFQADLDRLELEHLHEMQDATDPCELEEINQKWQKNYNTALKDDFWAKSYYKSSFYKKWQDRNHEAQQKIYYAKQHEFAEICATSTLNKMAETASMLDNPADVQQYLVNGEAMLANTKHLTAEAKYKLMTNFYKDTVSRLYESDPNKAVAFLDSVGNKYDAYGVSSEEIKTKAANYYKAKERERLADIARAQRMEEKANKALTTQLKARILQNPEQAESIINEAANTNDAVYVGVADWYRKGLGKDTNKARSPLSQEITSELVSGKTPEEVYKSHPELVNDSDARTALKAAIDIPKKLSPSEKEDIIKQVKAEIASLDTEDKFYDYIAEPEKLTRANVYASEALKNVGKQYGYGENNVVDSLKTDILNARTLDDVEKLRGNIATSGLSAKDKNTLLEKANTRENNIRTRLSGEESKAYREETRENKRREKEFKQASNEAEDSLYSYENQGSDKYFSEAQKVWEKLSPEAKRRVRATYTRLAKDEKKEDKDLLKQSQQLRYNELNTMRREGTLTQDLIDEEAEKENISSKQADKLSENLWKQNEKNIETQHKTDVEEDKQLIYINVANGTPTDASELKTTDSKVISLLHTTNQKTNENNYNKKLANIKDTLWQNTKLADDVEILNDYIDELTALNINQDKSPADDVQVIVDRIHRGEANKEKNLRDSLSRKLGTPLFKKEYTPYEMGKRNAAMSELESLIDNDKDVSEEVLNRIANTYRPTKEGYYKQTKNNDETYYTLNAEKDNLFVTSTEKGVDAYGNEAKRTVVALSQSAKFTDLDNYIQNLNNNYGLQSDGTEGTLTDKQYQELYKPIAQYMNEIIRRSSKDNTIEGYAMSRVIDVFNGKGQPIENPTELYEIYRDVINSLEEKGAERTGSVARFWGFTKKDIDEIIDEKMKMPKGNRYGR